jgi:hypothetical protein
MIDVVVLADLFIAVITFTLLGVVLTLYIGGSVIAAGISFTCPSPAADCAKYIPIGRPVSLCIFGAGFLAGISPFSFTGKRASKICDSPFAGAGTGRRWVSAIEGTFAFQNRHPIRHMVSAIVFRAVFGVRSKPTVRLSQPSFLVGSIVPSSGFRDALPVRNSIFLLASFAEGYQSIASGFISMKVFSRRRKVLAALGALLQGHIWGCDILRLHQKFTFLLPSPRPFPRRWDTLFSPVILPQTGGIL